VVEPNAAWLQISLGAACAATDARSCSNALCNPRLRKSGCVALPVEAFGYEGSMAEIRAKANKPQ
jgi:hypothetical protein